MLITTYGCYYSVVLYTITYGRITRRGVAAAAGERKLINAGETDPPTPEESSRDGFSRVGGFYRCAYFIFSIFFFPPTRKCSPIPELDENNPLSLLTARMNNISLEKRVGIWRFIWLILKHVYFLITKSVHKSSRYFTLRMKRRLSWFSNDVYTFFFLNLFFWKHFLRH